jgi:hypothetical protein
VVLPFPLHSAHQSAHARFQREPDRQWAACPLRKPDSCASRAAHLGGSRDALRGRSGSDCQSPGHEFWPVDTDLRDLSDSQRCPPSPGTTGDFRHRDQGACVRHALREFSGSAGWPLLGLPGNVSRFS